MLNSKRHSITLRHLNSYHFSSLIPLVTPTSFLFPIYIKNTPALLLAVPLLGVLIPQTGVWLTCSLLLSPSSNVSFKMRLTLPILLTTAVYPQHFQSPLLTQYYYFYSRYLSNTVRLLIRLITCCHLPQLECELHEGKESISTPKLRYIADSQQLFAQ